MTPIPHNILQSRYEGGRAAYAGRPIEANPHTDPDLREAWEDGWGQKKKDLAE